MMNVSVIGAGYVGLVSGVCLAEKGHRVICVDVDEEKVDRINRGIPPIHEVGLEQLLVRNVGSTLTATMNLRQAVMTTDLSLIAVGTPFRGDLIDLSQIRQASHEIGMALAEKDDYHCVIVKSTVVPGTTEEIVLPILEAASRKQGGEDFGIGMNPEFLREGVAVDDFMHPDRIVLGAGDERTLSMLENLYQVFPNVDIIRTSPKTAEMIKYAANSLLATLISFSNEIGNLAALLGGIDIVDVMRGVHLDKRLSPILSDGSRLTPAFTTYLEAGCGFGGSCFPKDVKALIAHGRNAGASMELLDSVIRINEGQPREVIRLLGKHFPDLTGRRISVLGLSFKPGTDDMRESPAIPVVDALRAGGAIVTVFDPAARASAERVFGANGIVYKENMETAVEDAEAILVLTRWDQFLGLSDLLHNRDPAPLVVDGRRMLDKNAFPRYEGIGT